MKLTTQQKEFLKTRQEYIKSVQNLQDAIFEDTCFALKIKGKRQEDWLFDYLYNNGNVKDLERGLQ